MLTNKVCCHQLSFIRLKIRKGHQNTIKSDSVGHIMDAFTITKMHYSMVSLFCDLVWPLYLFALAELSSVAVLFALFYEH